MRMTAISLSLSLSKFKIYVNIKLYERNNKASKNPTLDVQNIFEV